MLRKHLEAFQARWQRQQISIIPFFKIDANSVDRSSSDVNDDYYVWEVLIDYLLKMNPVSTDKDEFFRTCAKELERNNAQLRKLEQFHLRYTSEEALTWYTKANFLFSTLNKALRTQNIELLYLMRFFIRDIHDQLERNQFTSATTVYRCQFVSLQELWNLEKSIGKRISMNSFLSTSLSRDVAMIFLDNTGTTNLTYDSAMSLWMLHDHDIANSARSVRHDKNENFGPDLSTV